MKKIILTLLLAYSTISFSQSFTGFKIGEKILNQNIYIINDTIETEVSVLEDGYCYRIVSKFTDTNDSPEDIEYVKSLVKTNNEWDYYNNINNYDLYDYEYNRDEPCLGSKLISCVLDNDIKYLIYYIKKRDEYDETKPGLILVERKTKMADIQDIQKKIKYKPNSSITFTSYNEFINSQVYKDKNNAKSSEIKIETIELPYKLNFGMNNTQISNHLKSILDKNSVLTIGPFKGDPSDIKLGITFSSYTVKTNGAFSFGIEVTFLNGKAFEYNYHHDYNMDKMLREKISKLTKNTILINTTFGNNIYDTKTKEKVAEIKENYRNRGNLENKM